MIGGVDDFDDFRNFVLDHHFDALFEGHVGHATALTAAAESDDRLVFIDSDEFDDATVGSHGGVDLLSDDICDFLR